MSIELFFIGENFYWETGTIMSSIYEVRTYKRYDWGFVNRDLREGKKVNIRPATKEEMEWVNNNAKIIKFSEEW